VNNLAKYVFSIVALSILIGFAVDYWVVTTSDFAYLVFIAMSACMLAIIYSLIWFVSYLMSLCKKTGFPH